MDGRNFLVNDGRVYSVHSRYRLFCNIQKFVILNMPLFFLVIGFCCIDSGVRGNAATLFAQVKTDMTGFLALGAVILILGALGAVPSIRPVAKALLGLVFIAFFVKKGSAIWQNLQTGATTAPTATTAAAPVVPNPAFNNLPTITNNENAAQQTMNQISNLNQVF